ncbi:MAG: 4-(cytidine 5'-diphospho)-2-C-methyl-D-erythritol kinase [Cyclobacteriaceae bacterium]
MVDFPNAKINLGLNIVSKRPDGYHDIETCFYPIPLCDILEVVASDKLLFTSTGLDIPGDPKGNLCLKAYDLIKSAYDIPPVHIHLHKVIPMGAGLGGGSADGAFTLKLLNDKFDLNIEAGELERLAGKLGSDCPFFVKNEPVFAQGTGTDFSDIEVSLKGKYIALVHPKVHVSTQEAYGGVVPRKPAKGIQEILQMTVSSWQEGLINDFEKSVFENHPSIKEVKRQLYEAGALYASMSGSGSSVFGIFEERPDAKLFDVYEL